MVLKKVLGIVNDFLSKMGDSAKEDSYKHPPLYTEEDILKAMDDLPPLPEKQIGYLLEELNCTVPRLGVWSSFEYLSESPSGFKDGKKRFFYVIPAGWEYEAGLKMWYLGIHFNDDITELFEFNTSYDYTGEQEPLGK